MLPIILVYSFEDLLPIIYPVKERKVDIIASWAAMGLGCVTDGPLLYIHAGMPSRVLVSRPSRIPNGGPSIPPPHYALPTAAATGTGLYGRR